MDKSQYIKIQNFRCFKELEVNDLKRVNLIGGKNNTGKTSLLEALLLYFYPLPRAAISLKQNRKESHRTTPKSSINEWNSLFYNQNTENNIFIRGCFEHLNEQTIKISVTQSVQLQLFEEEEEFGNNIRSPIPIVELKIAKKIKEGESIKYSSNYSDRHSSNYRDNYSSIPFIPSSFISSFNYSIKLAKQYDKIDYEGKSEEVLKILKTIDPSIEGLRTYSFAEPTLYIQTKIQPKGLPISLFGDAVYRVTAIILEILDKKHKVLFIDEIENGIHYTSQKSFWEGLFRLSEELDTLIFATTHSLEMIKAFAEAGKNFPDQGAYFELAYSPRTDNIVAINRDIDLLEYDLEHGKAIRGE
jgi:AAA15 family ATPase/GTPase